MKVVRGIIMQVGSFCQEENAEVKIAALFAREGGRCGRLAAESALSVITKPLNMGGNAVTTVPAAQYTVYTVRYI
jgi:hypothetical protein